ncbi:MAG TPA: HipA family kinase [Streptosporangiaceae bacterium]|nr:HipA family kinase [Streptosporangiaceae bacterium]
MTAAALPRVAATRYVTPLREGGSLPAVMEADDLGTYVVKFRGAGQGPKALIAEVISGQLARGLGLAVPELVTIEVDPAMAPGEPDQEIQDLLRASGGLNLGVDFLPGALDFDAARAEVAGGLAGRILWLDALVGNADRSWRNPNMLFWHGVLYLIDHGATLTFQHRWESAAAAMTRPYDADDHALIGCHPRLDEADAELAGRVTEDLLQAAAAAVPDEWLGAEAGLATPADLRAAYVALLLGRLRAREAWLPPLREAAARGGGERLPRAARAARPGWLTGSPSRRPGAPS